MIYLDNAATTPLSKAALDSLFQTSQNVFGNPSSIHNFGRAANKILREARESIADALKTNPNNIIFTSGGSEADTLAIQGYALANQHKGKHLITTAIEHYAVLHTMAYLEKRFGFEVTYIQPVNQEITAQQIAEALTPDTILVSTMFANNETGMILPIAEISQVLAEHHAVYHVDAVQVVGKLPVHPEELGIDMLSASAHKFHGPKGQGFLYSRVPNFDPLIHGGKQEHQHRAGTENLAAITAMAAALSEQLAHQKEDYQTVLDLRNYFIAGLQDLDFYLNESFLTLPHVLNIGFTHQLNEQLLMRLDLAGIAVSSGSACTAGAVEKSHVLTALYGENSHRLRESLRFSFSEQNTIQELDYVIQTLKEMIGGQN